MVNHKKITISIPDWVWEKYVNDYEGNRSSFIIEKFILGFENDVIDYDSMTKINDKLRIENKKLKTHIAELKNKIERFRKGKREMTAEEKDLALKKNYVRTIRASGIMED